VNTVRAPVGAGNFADRAASGRQPRSSHTPTKMNLIAKSSSRPSNAQVRLQAPITIAA
jgi:hypothetical protein